MRVFALAFFAGNLVVHRLAVLPGRSGTAVLACLFALIVACGGRRHLFVRVVAGLAVGFCWAWLSAAVRLDERLDPVLEAVDITTDGVIASIPELRSTHTRFLFQPDDPRLPNRIRLNWYSAPRLHAAQRWRLTVRLKRPHGMLNPGGFDYERWLFLRGIGATGYVRPAPSNEVLASRPYSHLLLRVRARISKKLEETLGSRPALGIVEALAIGERSRISSSQWDLFARTGTGHLIAISGLHVGIVAGFLFFVVRGVWVRLPPLSIAVSPPVAAAVIAMLGALAYAALAGFSLPTRRAVVMLAVVLGAVAARRELAAGQGLALALLLVLLTEPLAPLSAGFWLSFGAVAAILLGSASRHTRSAIGSFCRAQYSVFVGLAPVLFIAFSRISLIAPFTNSFMIPLFALCLVPIVLLGTMLALAVPLAGHIVLTFAAWLLELVLPLVDWLGSLSIAQWSPSRRPLWTLLVAIPGLLLCFTPRGFAARILAPFFFLPVCFWRPSGPAVGTFDFVLLDVGQGLAAIVETRNHLLVYDAGAKQGRLDAGSAVIEPYLKHGGHKRIDRVVISHGDADHAGGLATLQRKFEILDLSSGTPETVDGARRCRAGEFWVWDGVSFEILHPDSRVWRGNNASCVLRVSTPGGVLLLSGDIEKAAERRLADHASIAADVVVVPHHGSATSSSQRFVAASAPVHVLFAAGYRNRWQFPRESVARRWSDNGAKLHDTACGGALSVHFDSEGVGPVQSWRQNALRYWHDPPSGSHPGTCAGRVFFAGSAR
ncbi:MAG: DNA internalization-related competence protein ComEC/Rec2 [Gammaproteobacteria bacterium]